MKNIETLSQSGNPVTLSHKSISAHTPNLPLDLFPTPQEQLTKALLYLSENQLLPTYTGDFNIERLDLSDSSQGQSKTKSLITNLILNQGYYLRRVEDTKSDLAVIEDHLKPLPATKSQYYLTRGLLGGTRTLDQTKALLDQSLTTNQKIVFISYRWSKENDPQIDQLCQALTTQGILPLRDRDSFELGDRIDEYMKLINHPALDQVIMLVDEGYLTSRNCMNEMRLTFRNPELSKSKAIIIPLTGSLFTTYQSKKGQTIKHWQEKHDQYQRDGNIKEAELSLQITKRAETFLDTMGMQTSEILSKRAEANYTSLITQINKLPKQTTPNPNQTTTQLLPFSKDRFYIGRENEQDFIIHSLTPGHITTLIGPGGIGKSALVRHTLRTMESDLFKLFPDGVILVEFNSGITVLKAISEVILALDPTNDLKDIYRTYKRLVTTRRALLLIDGAEDARIQKQETHTLDDMLDPIEQSKSSVIMTTRVHNEVREPERTITLTELNKEEQRELLLKYLANYRPLLTIYQQLIVPNQDDEVTQIKPANSELNQILSYLGGLPLAIELAGSYLSRTNIPLKTFPTELEKSPFALLNKDKSKVKSSDHHQGVEYLILNNITQLETIPDPKEAQISKEALLILGNGAYSAHHIAD
jgi:hypothetical protein